MRIILVKNKMQHQSILFTLIMLMTLVIFSEGVFAKALLSAEQSQLQKDSIKYSAYIPKNYRLFEAIQGDLNQDGQKDWVLIVKATDPKQVVMNRFEQRVDRNRRGIVVLLNQQGKFKKITENLTLFSSENEEGGVYFAPELVTSIEKARLKIHYVHGRYGYWSYTFRLDGNRMRLVGYDRSNNFGPYVDSLVSINFLTAKKLIRDHINQADRGQADQDQAQRFKETWSAVHFAPIYLSSIKDMDELIFE